MINHIEVDGFRSLTNFQLRTRIGLNILVGPNGSGKTNIIEFYQFLSYLMRSDVGRAISMSGGAGSVFRKSTGIGYKPSISATISGSVKSSRTSETDKVVFVHYEYSFAIDASTTLDQVHYSRQSLRLRYETKGEIAATASLFPGLSRAEAVDEWGIEVLQFSTTETPPHINITRFAPENLSSRYSPSMLKRLFRYRSNEQEHISLPEAITSILEDRASPYLSFLEAVSLLVGEVDDVIADITGGEILNIVPWRVRQPEDSATTEGIRSDGSGLAATLYSLRHEVSRLSNPRSWVPRRGPGLVKAGGRRIYNQIEEYLQLVNPTILSMNVRNDPFDNRIMVRFTISGAQGNIELPISSMSDGTVKWLALITAVLTYRTVFAIEEPENFLHPAMQQEILHIMRENTNRRDEPGFVIMTTHSETLLNSAEPEEVVVVSMTHGQTRAVRTARPDFLREEIRSTGFGLGYYYRTGALDDA